MGWLFNDPKLFNYIIMGLYVGSAAWWFVHGEIADGFYWLAAMGITATVTFGYTR